MSWSVFKAKCNVLTGNPHVTPELFAFTIADAYVTCISMHFDSMSGMGVVTTFAPKLPLLQQQILMYCNLNRQSHADIDLLAQIGPAFVNMWPGEIIIGPTGITTVTSGGVWQNTKVQPNTNFQVILNALERACRVHITTLTGQYISTVIQPFPPVPWVGSLLQSMP